MVNYSQHFLLQIKLREIFLTDVEDVLENPDSIFKEDGLQVYQKKITENSKLYILRIFVNEEKQPPLVVTAYKTSKIKNTLSCESTIR